MQRMLGPICKSIKLVTTNPPQSKPISNKSNQSKPNTIQANTKHNFDQIFRPNLLSFNSISHLPLPFLLWCTRLFGYHFLLQNWWQCTPPNDEGNKPWAFQQSALCCPLVLPLLAGFWAGPARIYTPHLYYTKTYHAKDAKKGVPPFPPICKII